MPITEPVMMTLKRYNRAFGLNARMWELYSPRMRNGLGDELFWAFMRFVLFVHLVGRRSGFHRLR